MAGLSSVCALNNERAVTNGLRPHGCSFPFSVPGGPPAPAILVEDSLLSTAARPVKGPD